MDLISRKVVRDNGRAMYELIANALRELSQRESSRSNSQHVCHVAIEALESLRSATQTVLDAWQVSPERALSVAVPYLKLGGYVVGGWLMAKAHASASNRVGSEDGDFYLDKTESAHFYIDNVLPNVWARSVVIESGAASAVAADIALI